MILNKSVPEITLSVKFSFPPKIEQFPKITSSNDAAKILTGAFNSDTFCFQEEFVMLCLNRANCVIGFFHVSKGGTSGTVADPKIILMTALNTPGTTGIILAHNHPSGNLNPSKADLNITEKIKKAASFLDIAILDHIILCDNTAENYYSFADNGTL